MKVLGISGSPREGATSAVVREALAQAEQFGGVETSFFSVRGKKINYCIHCDHCIEQKKGCVFKDAMDELYPVMESADVWILGTPVYQGSMSGQLKALLDRCRASVARDPEVFRNKIGVALTVGGDRNGGQEPTIMEIHSFFLANQMLPVSGGPFGSNLGGTIWSKDLGAAGADADEYGLATVRRTVKRAMELAELLRKGAKT